MWAYAPNTICVIIDYSTKQGLFFSSLKVCHISLWQMESWCTEEYMAEKTVDMKTNNTRVVAYSMYLLFCYVAHVLFIAQHHLYPLIEAQVWGALFTSDMTTLLLWGLWPPSSSLVSGVSFGSFIVPLPALLLPLHHILYSFLCGNRIKQKCAKHLDCGAPGIAGIISQKRWQNWGKEGAGEGRRGLAGVGGC